MKIVQSIVFDFNINAPTENLEMPYGIDIIKMISENDKCRLYYCSDSQEERLTKYNLYFVSENSEIPEQYPVYVGNMLMKSRRYFIFGEKPLEFLARSPWDK